MIEMIKIFQPSLKIKYIYTLIYDINDKLNLMI